MSTPSPALGDPLFGLHGTLSLIGIVLFALRSEHEPVKSRNRVLVILQSLCGVGYYAAVVYALPIYACPTGYFLFPLGVPMLVMPYIYRAFTLWYSYLLNQKTLRVNTPENDEHAEMFPTINPLFAKHWVLSKRWMTSWGIQLLVFLAYPALFLAVLIPTFLVPLSTTGGDCILVPEILISLQTTILLLLTFFFAVILGRVKDRYYIKLELQIMGFFALPLTTLACVLFFIPSLLPWWLSGQNVMVIISCLNLLFSVYMPTFLSFSWVIKCLHTETRMSGMGHSYSLTGKGDMFFRCLQDARLAKSFEKFCVESFSVENLFFYRHAVQFRSLKGEFLITEAYRMRYEYISSESVFEVELSPRVKERVLKRIEDKEIDDTLFLAAEQEVYLTMKQGIYPLWKRSEGFKELARGGLLRTRSLMKGNQFVTPVDEDAFESERARRQSMESDNSLANPVKMTPPPKKPSLGADSVKRAIDQISQRENSIELVRAASQKQSEAKQITSLESPIKEEVPLAVVPDVKAEKQEEKGDDKENLKDEGQGPEEGKKELETELPDSESPGNSTPANQGPGSIDSDLNDVVGRESTDLDPLQPAGEE